ncbi:hypothetical protein CC80DRAFT_583526 [Byssothecium circinans]|uniref:Uncharacterized protein n=1 Tax=Byssothecium circinans TaxID=147558 RepID=A0A6A5T7Z2_9PLEO|nr:hypothetical protein CC80DRAFT_583526 [Byssothecium circinans]
MDHSTVPNSSTPTLPTASDNSPDIPTFQHPSPADVVPLPNHLSFLKLPGEVRNRIYHHALGMHQNYHVPRRLGTPRNDGFKLLFLNKQIHTEVYTLFILNANAYIPILPGMNIERLLNESHIKELRSCILPVAATLIGASYRMLNVHIHLHVPDIADIPTNKFLLHELQEMMFFLAANSEPWKWGGQKKNVTLHLDHYFSDWWKHELQFKYQKSLLPGIMEQIGEMSHIN